MPTSQRYLAGGLPSPWGRTSARSARIPPSPRLSARITTVRYLRVTTKLSDQKISDSIPRTLPLVTGTPCGPDEALLERVERAGPDVAVDHSQGAQGDEGERPEAGGRLGLLRHSQPFLSRCGETKTGEAQGADAFGLAGMQGRAEEQPREAGSCSAHPIDHLAGCLASESTSFVIASESNLPWYSLPLARSVGVELTPRRQPGVLVRLDPAGILRLPSCNYHSG